MSREPILGYSRKQRQNRHRTRGKIPKQYKREANKPLWAGVTNQSAKRYVTTKQDAKAEYPFRRVVKPGPGS